MKRLLLAAVLAALMVVASASAALAGEVNGKGEVNAAPTHANSICAFSGLIDGFDPEEPFFTKTQSWGQVPKELRAFLTSIGESPGVACRGGSNPRNP